MAEKSGCAKWGCGCLAAILVWYVGIPAVMLGGRLAYEGIKSVFAWRAANVEKRRALLKEKEETRRVAEERAEIAARSAAKQAKAAAEQKAANEAKMRAAANREDRLRSFALKEATVLWKAYQDLGAQIDAQGQRIEELRKTLVEFNKNPEQDADFRAICTMRDAMIGVRSSLRRKIEDAYFAFRKFEATPSRKDYDELRRKAVEDGIQEAMSAIRRFNLIRKEK